MVCMSLNVGFVRQGGPHGIMDPYRAVVTDFKSSENLSVAMKDAGAEDERVEAFMVHDGPLCEMLKLLAGVNGEQEDSFLQQLEELLTHVYKIGRGRAINLP